MHKVRYWDWWYFPLGGATRKLQSPGPPSCLHHRCAEHKIDGRWHRFIHFTQEEHKQNSSESSFNSGHFISIRSLREGLNERRDLVMRVCADALLPSCCECRLSVPVHTFKSNLAWRDARMHRRALLQLCRECILLVLDTYLLLIGHVAMMFRRDKSEVFWW